MYVNTTVEVNVKLDEDRIIFESRNDGTAYMKIEHADKSDEWVVMGATVINLRDMRKALEILEATRDPLDQ